MGYSCRRRGGWIRRWPHGLWFDVVAGRAESTHVEGVGMRTQTPHHNTSQSFRKSRHRSLVMTRQAQHHCVDQYRAGVDVRQEAESGCQESKGAAPRNKVILVAQSHTTAGPEACCAHRAAGWLLNGPALRAFVVVVVSMSAGCVAEGTLSFLTAGKESTLDHRPISCMPR